MQPNESKPAVHIVWMDYYDGRFPECPSCGEMPYSVDQCVFCGQKFLADPIAEEWKKPPEEVRIDCPICGGKKTTVGFQARSNGHFHGRCVACEIVMFE